MNASPYPPRPRNTQHAEARATTTDDSNGWETPQPPRLTFARVYELHELANQCADVPTQLMPAAYYSLRPCEADIFACEFFKARLRITHPNHPPGHITPINGPAATLQTIEHLRPYLENGTALFATGPLAVCVDKTRLLASQNPQAEINAAIAWLRAFAVAVIPAKPDHSTTAQHPV